MKKRLLVMLIAVMAVTGCGSSRYSDSGSKNYITTDYAAAEEAYDYDYEYDYKEDVAEESAVAYTEGSSTEVTTSENATTSNRKLIRNVDLSIETKDYDGLINGITNDINATGGYIEYMDVYNGSYNSSRSERNASITARIPAAKLDSFVNKVGEVANITNKTESVRDVTLTYVDMESHKNMLITERDHLIEMLEQADTIEEMIIIEDRLADIRYQIDSMESQLRTYDNQVDYSTVQLSIREVVTYTAPVIEEESAWERIANGFVESIADVADQIKEFFIVIIIGLPYIALFLFIVGLTIFILLKFLRLIPFYREWNDKVRAARKQRKADKKAAKAAKKAGKQEVAEANEATDKKEN